MNPKILQSKSVMTKFQILTEIADNQPMIKQREIAKKIEITPQAVSEYIKELISNELIHSEGRGRYKITKNGIEWILEHASELKKYSQFVMEDIISLVSTWTAICERDIKKGEKIHIKMKDGLLYATDEETSIYGTAIDDGFKGYDIGITNLKGTMHVEEAQITICKIPRINHGGSCFVDLNKLESIVKSKLYIGAIGTESLISLKKINKTPNVMFGAFESVVQAFYHGLSSVIVIVEDEVPYFISKLENENIQYELIDLILKNK